MTDNDPSFKGFNTEEVPAWLKKPPKSQRSGWVPPPQSAPTTHTTPAPQVVQRQAPRYVVTNDRSAANRSLMAAGIGIIASLMAYSFWFSVVLVASVMANPPDTVVIGGFGVEGDVWTFGRVAFCTIAALLLTAATWFVAMTVTEE